MIPKEKDKNDELHEENNDETTKLLEYHAKNYFNSTMGGKDVWVLFAMAILDAICETLSDI